MKKAVRELWHIVLDAREARAHRKAVRRQVAEQYEADRRAYLAASIASHPAGKGIAS